MDSPSAQLIEHSMIDFDAPPSSPFVAEVGLPSRSPSKHHGFALDGFEEDKENIKHRDSTLAKLFSPPTKALTPERPPSRSNGFKKNDEPVLMPPPPPSTQKVSVSPRKTPLRASRSEAPTPRSVSRGNDFARTPSQSAARFQAGLDARKAMMPVGDQTLVDDTCFSTFSAVPDMTVFAKLGHQQSPTRRNEVYRTPHGDTDATPRTSRKRSSPSRSPSPTPRRQKTPNTAAKREEDTGTFLIDFTQQLEGVTRNFASHSPSNSQTESNLLSYINNQRSPNKSGTRHTQNGTPNKNLLNLLDFELPPAPTPRSIPTITVRELESLKSSYLSQISSLKATLSGREAEVDSLKKAVGDAERRVGEAQETLRDEASRREHLENENDSWKKRGLEFESVLKTVKEEVLKSEAEKDETNRKLEECERRADEGEARAVKAEERYADVLATRMSGAAEGDSGEDQVQRLVSAQIDAKIEAVSRELHAVYKEKHERKVATLKKSYEARNEKKTADLQARVSELEKTNEDLQAAKDATFSGPVSNVSAMQEENIALKSQLEAQNAAIARLESEMSASKQQQDQLERELNESRIENGDLVAAVDEMLALQMDGMAPPATPQGARAVSVVEDFRKSIRRPSLSSGLRAPGSATGIPGASSSSSAIGRGLAPAALNRSLSGSVGSGGVGKSRMLANIERMGRTGSHGGPE